MTRQVTFERLGRNHDPDPLPIGEEQDPQAIAEAVYRHVRRYLASRDVEVVVAEDKVTVFAGFHVGGSGRIEEVIRDDRTY